MWLLFACGSAIFAGVTAVLAKIGMQHINSTVATALRTGVVLLFSWLLVLLTGAISGIGAISGKTFLFLILSGCATGASWLCYFQALQLGDVNQVAPIDKSSTILTMLLAFLFLGEALTVQKVICMLLIGAGTFLMLPKRTQAKLQSTTKKGWLFYAILVSFFPILIVIHRSPVTGRFAFRIIRLPFLQIGHREYRLESLLLPAHKTVSLPIHP